MLIFDSFKDYDSVFIGADEDMFSKSEDACSF